jgi:excisionase family DNA binding protein
MDSHVALAAPPGDLSSGASLVQASAPASPQILQILTISEAARELHIAVQTARAWSDAGKLPSVRTAGGMRLFRREDVERIRAERRQVRGEAA